MGTNWTPAADAVLIERFRTASWEELSAAFPDRTIPAIRSRAQKLGLRRGYNSVPIRQEAELRLKSLSDADRAYLAGFFDGEGCIRLKRSGMSFKAAATITSACPPALERFRAAFGGHLKNRGIRSNKVVYTWSTVRMVEVYALVIAILPYSIEKRAQLEVACDYITARLAGLSARHPSDEIRQQGAEAFRRLRELKRQQYPNYTVS